MVVSTNRGAPVKTAIDQNPYYIGTSTKLPLMWGNAQSHTSITIIIIIAIIVNISIPTVFLILITVSMRSSLLLAFPGRGH